MRHWRELVSTLGPSRTRVLHDGVAMHAHAFGFAKAMMGIGAKVLSIDEEVTRMGVSVDRFETSLRFYEFFFRSLAERRVCPVALTSGALREVDNGFAKVREARLAVRRAKHNTSSKVAHQLLGVDASMSSVWERSIARLTRFQSWASCIIQLRVLEDRQLVAIGKSAVLTELLPVHDALMHVDEPVQSKAMLPAPTPNWWRAVAMAPHPVRDGWRVGERVTVTMRAARHDSGERVGVILEGSQLAATGTPVEAAVVVNSESIEVSFCVPAVSGFLRCVIVCGEQQLRLFSSPFTVVAAHEDATVACAVAVVLAPLVFPHFDDAVKCAQCTQRIGSCGCTACVVCGSPTTRRRHCSACGRVLCSQVSCSVIVFACDGAHPGSVCRVCGDTNFRDMLCRSAPRVLPVALDVVSQLFSGQFSTKLEHASWLYDARALQHSIMLGEQLIRHPQDLIVAPHLLVDVGWYLLAASSCCDCLFRSSTVRGSWRTRSGSCSIRCVNSRVATVASFAGHKALHMRPVWNRLCRIAPCRAASIWRIV